MTSRRRLRSLSRLLPLLLLSLALPNAALSQLATPGPRELAPEARTRLAQAAEDSQLAPWQRDVMLRLARTGTAAASDPSPAGQGPTPPTLASGASYGGWTDLTTNPPSARFVQSAIYDPVRNRMVVFGGYDALGFRNDVWELSLAGAPAWTQLTPTGDLPAGRYGHSAIYDPVRDRMVVFGGSDYDGTWHRFNDVWALSLAGTPEWTSLTPAGTPPSGRLCTSAVYDSVRDRMVIFAGSNGSAALNDVWVLSLGGMPAWAQLTPLGTPPSARYDHAAVYDPVRDRMMVFGGFDGLPRNDVWELSLANPSAWTLLTPAGTPPLGRHRHSAIYDPVDDRMVVFGGAYLQEGSWICQNDVWELSLADGPNWTLLVPAGTPPSGRAYHSAIYDAAQDRMVVFAGHDGSGSTLNDAWALSLETTPAWTLLSSPETLPGALDGHSAIYDSVRDRMVVFGGVYSSTLNDVWTLPLAGPPVWTRLTPSGTPPSARGYHSAIYDSMHDRMVIFGGYDDSGSWRGDVWALSLAGPTAWTQLIPLGTPPTGRGAHSAIYDPARNRMLVFGGIHVDSTTSSVFNDVWELSLGATPTWAQLHPTGTPPSERYCHSAIHDPLRDRMVVFGGYDGSALGEVWALSLADTPAWTQLTPFGTPPDGRFAHSAILDPRRDCMVVFGGDCGDGSGNRSNDVWALTLAGPMAWMQLPPMCPSPSGRGFHSAIYDPTRGHMVVFAGSGASGVDNDVWELDWGTTRWWDGYTPIALGYSWTYRAEDVPRDTTLSIFENIDHEGNPAFKSGNWDSYTVMGSVGSADVVYAQFEGGSLFDFTPHLVFGAFGDGSIFDAGSSNMIRDWEIVDAALRDTFALDAAYDDVIMVAAYDSDFGSNVQNAVIESNLPPCVTPPPGAVTAIEWYQRGVGKVAFADVDAASGDLHEFYRLISTNVAVSDPKVPPPLVSGLRPPVPNPARGMTAVSYAIAQAGRVQLGVFDVSGRLVRRLVDGERRAGTETVVWNGTDASGARLVAGVYFVRLAGPGLRETRRVVLLH